MATISLMAEPEVALLFIEHRQLGVRPIPLEFIFPHVLHKDKTIFLLRFLGLLLRRTMLALGVILLVVLPANRSSPPTVLTWKFGTTISQVPIIRVFRRVLIYKLDFLD